MLSVSETLLQTKLYIPPIRSNLVPRPQLLEQLNQGLQLGHKLTLICAPAGFGKTTLASAWVTACDRPAAWLSLDEGDNDPARFLAYFIGALNRIEAVETSLGRGTLSMLQAPQQPPIEAILTSLINDIAGISGRIIFVLDDYHNIESSLVDDALAFLLENQPPQLHLVIATRDDPQFPLSRLRARGQLSELRAIDLRFTSSEAGEFLNQAMGLALSAEDIAALESRTEGWIAGLQLAAISMQGRQDTSTFIKSFTGSHRFVLDYLLEEVLEQQSDRIQDFLLQTAVLDRLTGPLCDALTGQEDGREMLDLLERANLFIVPLDEERRWYRYHHLFADLLRQRLRQTKFAQIPLLQIRASVWYEKNRFADEAIQYALRAEDFERAVHLIEEHSDPIWRQGEHIKLRRWLASLPIELVYAKPQLAIFHAEGQFVSGQQEAAEQSLLAAEQMLDQIPAADRGNLAGRAAATRAFLAFYQGDMPGIIRHSREALDSLPENDAAWRSSAANAIGDAHIIKGDMAAAQQVQTVSLEASKAMGNIYMTLVASMKLAITLRHQGHLQQAVDICRQQLQLAEENGLSQTVVAGWLLAIWGEVLAETNDLETALQLANRGVDLTMRGGRAADVAMLGWSYICLTRVLFSTGNTAGAGETVQTIENIALETDFPPWITRMIAAWQARIWLAQGRLETACQWVDENGFDTPGASGQLQEVDFFLMFDYLVLSRILIAQERLDEAAGLLTQLLEVTRAQGQTAREIEILLLQTLTFQAAGKTDRALSALEDALTLAEPAGFMRTFVDEGPPLAHLLQKATAQGIAPNYASRLLSALPTEQGGIKENIAAIHIPHSTLMEPLSEREREVLQLIAEGLTNREIADRLYLSPNTVKVHSRNIYGKLDVHNRTQAIARARALGILPTI